MGSHVHHIEVRSRNREEMIDITGYVRESVRLSGIQEGVCHLFVLHTTAGLTVNEGADPAVQNDMLRFLSHMIPVDDRFTHQEGNSDAHIKASLIGSGVSLLVTGGQLVLGTWQAVYLCDFDGPRTRKVAMKIVAG